MNFLKPVTMAALAIGLSACATTPGSSFKLTRELAPDAVPTFANEAQVDAYVRAQAAERVLIREQRERAGIDNSDRILVTGSRIVADVSVTNTQEAGVDEGGIVKANTEFLVILRRGRVYVVRHSDETLEQVSSIDAFPPGDSNPDDTWYDEMLVHQGMVIVIGYSYGGDGTEISRFQLSNLGELTYRDTHYLSSSDYYSSSNYASRMIGGTFFTYTPTLFTARWREELPFLERRREDGSRIRIGSTLLSTSMGLGAPLLIDPSPLADMMHGITSCDVLSPAMACSTRTVLGTEASEYYFNRDAAYIWTGTGHINGWGRASQDWGKILYRIPLDSAEDPTAMAVEGVPIDQFSFHEDMETDSLFVMTTGDFEYDYHVELGLTTWDVEAAIGGNSLARIPLDQMGNGAVQLPRALYRALPETRGRVQNRYVGRHLMYGSGYYGAGDEPPDLFVTPLDESWVQRIALPHGVSRLDRLGSDGVAIGRGEGDALGFSAIEFAEDRPGATLGSTYMFPAAEEGENRSQAFYWRPDADNPDSGGGLMALPVNKEIEGYDFYYLGSSTAMFYLERRDGALFPMGELGTQPDEEVIAAAQKMEELEEAGECQASCVDWYGNSRPIFIGERIFALMGDQIVEGSLAGGRITEERRINFAR